MGKNWFFYAESDLGYMDSGKYRNPVYEHLKAYILTRVCTPPPPPPQPTRRLTDSMNIQKFDVNCVTFCRYPVQANPLDDLRQGAELPDDSAPLQQRHPHVERLQRPHGNAHVNAIIKKENKQRCRH